MHLNFVKYLPVSKHTQVATMTTIQKLKKKKKKLRFADSITTTTRLRNSLIKGIDIKSHYFYIIYCIHKYRGKKIWSLRHHTTDSRQSSLTTEELRGPKVGRAPGLHLFTVFLQALVKERSFVGLVAPFTSVRPFPQAEEATSHKKVKIAVTIRSCGMKVGV